MINRRGVGQLILGRGARGPPKRNSGYLRLLILFILILVFAAAFITVYFFIYCKPHHRSDVHLLTSFIEDSEKNLISSTEKFKAAWDATVTDAAVLASSAQDRFAHSSIISLPNTFRITSEPLVPKKKRLAFVITITKDGFFQDGAAVLAYSIIKYSRQAGEIYDISFIAFVHPTVVSSRVGLRRLGFHVIEVPTPVNTSAIPFEFLRDHIDKNGCCGAAELIKLTSYRLLQYHRVIHLDADTMLLNPITELFDRNYSLVYTTDPNMASHKGEDKMPVQGGFIVMQPNETDYHNLINIVMTTEFAKGGAWNRSKIGWFWGGMTVQGVLPYYYNLVTRPVRDRRQIVDRCYYNTMADVPECQTQKVDELKSAHFTVCQKPWNCFKAYVNRLCGDLHRRWFEMRREAEAFYNISVVPKACPGLGKKHYISMNLQHAQVPFGQVPFLVPDDSPDRFDPIPEARYIGTDYN